MRARAVDALGAVAKPSKQEVVEALMACAQETGRPGTADTATWGRNQELQRLKQLVIGSDW